MKHKIIISLLIVILIFSNSSCNSVKEYETKENIEKLSNPNSTPFGRYEETVFYTLGNMTGINNSNMPLNDTYEDNAYTRLIKNVINAQNKDMFEVSDLKGYDDVVSMAIAARNIPDIMVVNHEQLELLIKKDLICDLEESYNNCASKKIKSIYNSYGSDILDYCRYNGRLMAIPSTHIDNGPDLLWLRKDWMDKLGLKDPKNIDDVYKIIKEFITKDPGNNGEQNTIGLICDSNLSGTETKYNSQYQLNVVFSAFNVFPKQWYYNENKELVYGSTVKEAKQALNLLSKWYKEKIIDNDFLLRTTNNNIELVVDGKCGSFFGPWWSPNNPLMDAKKQNKDVNWKPYLIETNKNGETVVTESCPVEDKYIVVKKGFSNPELACKIISVLFDYERYSGKELTDLKKYFQKNVDPTARPLSVNVDFKDAIIRCYNRLSSVIDKKTDKETLMLLENSYYEACKRYMEDKNGSVDDWAAYESRITACKEIKNGNIKKLDTLFFKPTETMKKEWWKLMELEKKYYLEIITGEKKINEFDEFVNQWKLLGGDTITKEIYEVVK